MTGMRHCSAAAPHVRVDSCLSDLFHGLLTSVILSVIFVFFPVCFFFLYLRLIEMLLSRGWDDLAACNSFSSSSRLLLLLLCMRWCPSPSPSRPRGSSVSRGVQSASVEACSAVDARLHSSAFSLPLQTGDKKDQIRILKNAQLMSSL